MFSTISHIQIVMDLDNVMSNQWFYVKYLKRRVLATTIGVDVVTYEWLIYQKCSSTHSWQWQIMGHRDVHVMRVGYYCVWEFSVDDTL